MTCYRKNGCRLACGSVAISGFVVLLSLFLPFLGYICLSILFKISFDCRCSSCSWCISVLVFYSISSSACCCLFSSWFSSKCRVGRPALGPSSFRLLIRKVPLRQELTCPSRPRLINNNYFNIFLFSVSAFFNIRIFLSFCEFYLRCTVHPYPKFVVPNLTFARALFLRNGNASEAVRICDLLSLPRALDCVLVFICLGRSSDRAFLHDFSNVSEVVQ